jgi:hypothetical protein
VNSLIEFPLEDGSSIWVEVRDTETGGLVPAARCLSFVLHPRHASARLLLPRPAPAMVLPSLFRDSLHVFLL